MGIYKGYRATGDYKKYYTTVTTTILYVGYPNTQTYQLLTHSKRMTGVG